MKSKVINGLLGFVLVLLLWQAGSLALQKPFLPRPGLPLRILPIFILW